MKHCDYCGRENEDSAVHCSECGSEQSKTSGVAEAVPELGETGTKVDQRLVLLMRCRTLLEADMVVSQLRAAGIDAMIPDEFLVQAVSWNLNTFGFVRVQVMEDDYEFARQIVSVGEPSEVKGEQPPPIPGGKPVAEGCCGFCGKQNMDGATSCVECGSELASE